MTGRSPIGGTARVVRFNWPKYALVAVLAITAGGAVTAGAASPVVTGLAVVAMAGMVWSVVSLVVTWWVYDHRDIYGDAGGAAPEGPWVAVHAGFDDATPRLEDGPHGRPAAVLSLRTRGGASIDRAARIHPAPGLPARAGALPLADGRAARVHLTFAAHEVRDGDARTALFAGIARALRPGGDVVVTEHVLDTANLAAFGPGALHFRTRRTWLDLGAAAGLELVDESRLTPFVRRFTWRR
jgi:hypothetical protein